MRILDLTEATDDQRHEAARILFEAFAEAWPEAWPTPESAAREVGDAMEPGRVCRVAVGKGGGDEGGTVLGWVGGIPMYEGRVWEIHPLVVRPDHQRRGVGRALVADLERAVAARGGETLYLGTDDESGQTNLAGVDLYPGVLEKLAGLESVRGHPSAFYRKLGFEVVGVVPDANGFGRPDIMMAKRVVVPGPAGAVAAEPCKAPP